MTVDAIIRPDRSSLDELVPSRYALQIGEIEVLIISDGVLPIPAEVLAHNVDRGVLEDWLDEQFLPHDVAECPLNVIVVRSGEIGRGSGRERRCQIGGIYG